MKKRLIYGLEILVSLLVVGSLLWVAFFVKPQTVVSGVDAALFGYRNNFYGVDAADSEGRIVWAVGSGGRIIRSEDAGATWEIQSTPTQNNLQDIAVWSESAAVVVGDLGTVLVTDDAGASWMQVEIPVREFGEQLLQVYVEKGTERAWIAGTFGSVFRSRDRGISWEMTHPEIDVAWNDVTVGPDGTVWLVGEFGNLRRSDDGGDSWQDVSAGTDISLMSIAFADASHGAVVGLSGTILQSSDGGASWNSVATDSQSHLFNVEWTGSDFIAVGDAGLVGLGKRQATDWTFFRLAENNFGWYTATASAGSGRVYLSGANLGVLEDRLWKSFTQADGS